MSYLLCRSAVGRQKVAGNSQVVPAWTANEWVSMRARSHAPELPMCAHIFGLVVEQRRGRSHALCAAHVACRARRAAADAEHPGVHCPLSAANAQLEAPCGPFLPVTSPYPNCFVQKPAPHGRGTTYYILLISLRLVLMEYAVRGDGSACTSTCELLALPSRNTSCTCCAMQGKSS